MVFSQFVNYRPELIFHIFTTKTPDGYPSGVFAEGGFYKKSNVDFYIFS